MKKFDAVCQRSPSIIRGASLFLSIFYRIFSCHKLNVRYVRKHVSSILFEYAVFEYLPNAAVFVSAFVIALHHIYMYIRSLDL